MDDFSHLSVLISIVLGLGLTNLLMGLARIVQMRERVKLYWPTVLWAFVLLLVHVQMWWTMFGLRTFGPWTFQAFAVVLMQPILLFFLSALILPDFDRDEALDLKANYFAQSRWFFGMLLGLVFVSLLRNYVISGQLDEADFVFHLVFIVAGAAGIVFTSDLLHRLLAPVAVAVYALYIALLFTTLR